MTGFVDSVGRKNAMFPLLPGFLLFVIIKFQLLDNKNQKLLDCRAEFAQTL